MLDADPRRARSGRARLADVAAGARARGPGPRRAARHAAEQDTGPEQFGELRSLAGLRRLLDAVATPAATRSCSSSTTASGPTRSPSACSPSCSRAAEPPPYLGVIAAFRSEEVPAGSPAARDRRRAVDLARRAVAAARWRSWPNRWPVRCRADRPTRRRLADGNPFMAAAVLRGLVEIGCARLPRRRLGGRRRPAASTCRPRAARRRSWCAGSSCSRPTRCAALGRRRPRQAVRRRRPSRSPGTSTEAAADHRRRAPPPAALGRRRTADATSSTTRSARRCSTGSIADERRELHGRAADALIVARASTGRRRGLRPRLPPRRRRTARRGGAVRARRRRR